MQPEFTLPEFLEHNTAEDIHRRMMNNLPADIDDMPGGFPYDFTRPAAIEKSELIEYHLARALMVAFPMYAWDEWLDLHGRQVHLVRHAPVCASGSVTVTGIPGTEIAAGTVFCTPATDTGPAIGFSTDYRCVIDDRGAVTVDVTAVEPGIRSNVQARTISIMAKPVKGIISVCNEQAVTGGTELESNDDFYDRIAAEYASSMTYLGNDSDYIRWAKEAGAGDCIVVPAFEGPGTVKLVLVDGNGQPANEKLIAAVYDYIVSPADRSKRLLPTACAQLVCVSAVTVSIDYSCAGLQYDSTTDLPTIKAEFTEAVRKIYADAKKQGVLRYNDVRPLMSDIVGVYDFSTFLMNGGTENIRLQAEEYPDTGTLDFL